MKQTAQRIFEVAVEAVEPAAAVRGFLRRDGETLLVDGQPYNLRSFERVTVVGAGKAGAPMAAAVEEILGPRVRGGLINVKYGHTQPLRSVRLQEAGHPVPDESGRDGAQEMLDLVRSLGERDLVICLLSGGGSALLPLPAPGITLGDKQAATRHLLACGADIEEVNTVRKHLSRVKGGQLARAAAPATLVSLILSDVIGDRLDAIASGPTVPDATTYQDALAVVERYRLAEKLPSSLVQHLVSGGRAEITDTPKEGDEAFARTQNVIVGSNLIAIQAAAIEARKSGLNTLILSSFMEGETREIAHAHTAIAREILHSGNPVSPPACVLSGGETTVTLTGNGQGGRNQEFSLAAAIDLAGVEGVTILSAGTDGTDGPTDAAGAFADGTTAHRAKELGLSPLDFLDRSDSYRFFRELGDLLITGPTRTNVMDLRIMLVG